MTFSTRLKEEMAANHVSKKICRCELVAIIRYDSKISKNLISLSFENGAVARKVYKAIKELYGVSIRVIVRNQKRLRAKQIYILEVREDVLKILQDLGIYKGQRYHKIEESFFKDKEELMGFVRGLFLANGSVNDPSTSGYHLEFVFVNHSDAIFLNSLLHKMKFSSKVLRRNNRFMVYLKLSEEISDMIRLFEASSCLFYFEDIRIYRDHKNMLNRLNNCDIANQEKSIKTGINQLEEIKFLREHDLFDLLDEKTQVVMETREKYPDSSYQELADIITLENDYKIGKSGINHHFIKVKKLIEKFKNQNN